MKKIHFWENVLFYHQQMIFLILIFATRGLMTIFNKCSKFQKDLINILGDMQS